MASYNQEKLDAVVLESLRCAVLENDATELLTMSTTCIAADMICYDPCLEEFPDLNMSHLEASILKAHALVKAEYLASGS